MITDMRLKTFLAILFLLTPAIAFCQSSTTESLQTKYGGRAFFFYNNTLRMLNQQEDPAFDELIKDIEKMKFLMIDKVGNNLDYKKVLIDYKSEKFEEAMTSRHEGKNFDVFLKGSGKTEGMLVLINDESTLMVLDIVGSIAMDKVTTLWNTLDESADIGKRIKDFTSGNKKEKSKEDH